MTFAFRALPPGLHDTAEQAIAWFINRWGVRRGRVIVEEEFHPEVSFRPTFFTKTDDQYLLCIEVSDNIYNNTLDSVVLSCRDKGLPVKLVVAVPRSSTADSQYAAKLKSAKIAGVGILEVDGKSGDIVQQPLALSLAGVRPIDTSKFPRPYRQPLQQAYQTFRDGEPSKACSLVYDELEAASRKLATKAAKSKVYSTALKIPTCPWADLLSNIDKYLDRKDARAKPITSDLIARIVGVTGHRNASGHKPKTVKELVKRDQALRTRFETAVDLLDELIEAGRAFKI
ncbi:MAG: hypothetical protein ACRED5_12555 [Propylenella sp.]